MTLTRRRPFSHKTRVEIPRRGTDTAVPRITAAAFLPQTRGRRRPCDAPLSSVGPQTGAGAGAERRLQTRWWRRTSVPSRSAWQ